VAQFKGEGRDGKEGGEKTNRGRGETEEHLRERGGEDRLEENQVSDSPRLERSIRAEKNAWQKKT